jgi:hypothetical protein
LGPEDRDHGAGVAAGEGEADVVTELEELE